MSPLFSRIGRNLSMVRQPFMVFRLSLTPDEAVARRVAHWRTFKIRSETPGMREQFALAGWGGQNWSSETTRRHSLPIRSPRHARPLPSPNCFRRRYLTESGGLSSKGLLWR